MHGYPQTPSGKHIMMYTKEDVLALVDHLLLANVFNSVPGQAHSAFKSMPKRFKIQLTVKNSRLGLVSH